ncbi:MAG TPA: rhomboid family intramembrane serine protease [Acidobacteriaceae bacterium]
MPPRSAPIVMTFPPFTGFVRRIVLANVIAFFALALLGAFAPTVSKFLFDHLALAPGGVLHGEVWQLVTYSFVHLGLLDILLNMLMIWFIGSYMESSFGSRWVAELYFASVLGTSLTAVAILATRIPYIPEHALFSSSGAVMGLFIGFAVLFGEQEMLLFPLPFRIRAKYLAAIYVLVSLYFMIRGDLTNIAALGGMLAAYLYVKFAPRRGVFFRTSEWYFGLRNAYYRSKRRRAAKKFEVYMGKQGRDVRFDKEGKYIDPDKNPNDKRWMN